LLIFAKIQPDFLGKMITPAQILLPGAVLINLSFAGPIPSLVITVFFWRVAVGIALDGVSDLWVSTGRLAKHPRWSEIAT